MMKKRRTLQILLIVLSILASLKMLFGAVGLDEEYQVVMSYRSATGDRLFLDMWEPHQSSAFLCTLLMRPYLKLIGVNGIVLYLRLCGTLIHLGVSIYLYRVFRTFMGKDPAGLLALTYFNIIPKQIILPEFGIMQVWFYTLLSLFLIRYYHDGRKMRYLILAAVSLSLNVLSYPSCLVLFPFVLLMIGRLSDSGRWRDMGVVILVCGLCGAGYLGGIFTYTSPAELWDTLVHILNGDVTHSLTLSGKLLSFVKHGLYMAVLWAGCLLFARAAAKWKRLDHFRMCCLMILASCAVEVVYWVILDLGYESMSIHLITVTAAGLWMWAGRRREGRSEGAAEALLWKYGICGALLSLLAVAYLTDISLTESIPHAMPAAVCGGALLVLAVKGEQEEKKRSWLYLTLTVWCLTAVLGKGYTMRGSGDYNNVLQSGGIMKEGPAAGTVSTYISAYIYNCDYEDWEKYLRDGDRVLIVVDQMLNLGTIQYLFRDVEISHFSIVNPTAYDERLLEYWEMYPEKTPNVIIVDCWYGQLMTDPESWIIRYIEGEFGYTQADDGRYIRIYRK